MNPTTIETLKVIAAVMAAGATVLGSVYIVITRPLLKAMESQTKLIDGTMAAHTKSIDARLESQSKSIDAALAAFRAEIMTAMKTEFSTLRADMKDMESRLDKRIDTHVVRKD